MGRTWRPARRSGEHGGGGAHAGAEAHGSAVGDAHGGVRVVATLPLAAAAAVAGSVVPRRSSCGHCGASGDADGGSGTGASLPRCGAAGQAHVTAIAAAGDGVGVDRGAGRAAAATSLHTGAA